MSLRSHANFGRHERRDEKEAKVRIRVRVRVTWTLARSTCPALAAGTYESAAKMSGEEKSRQDERRGEEPPR